MKILYVITKSEFGGAQSVVMSLLEAHVRRGDSVALLTDRNGWLLVEAKKLGVIAYTNRFFSNSKNPITHILALWETKKIIKECNPEIISSHSFAGGVQARLANLWSRPLVHTAHGISFTKGVPLWRKLVSILWEGGLGLICTDALIAVSENDRNTIAQTLPFLSKKLHVIHNGVHIPFQEASFANEKIHIAYVARMAVPKTPWQVLKTFSQLSKNMREKYKITFVGEGNYIARLKSFSMTISSLEVSFVGFKNKEEFYKLNPDILVFTSRWEGFPMVILEAMAFGLPVIASDVGGVREVVDSSVGWLLPKGTHKEISEMKELFTQISENKSILVQKGHNARVRIKNNFTVEKMVEETFTVLDFHAGRK
jgi:glycosyltransferase involved in cell wall biosynthesis